MENGKWKMIFLLLPPAAAACCCSSATFSRFGDPKKFFWGVALFDVFLRVSIVNTIFGHSWAL
jgi:hypothetical protein